MAVDAGHVREVNGAMAFRTKHSNVRSRQEEPVRRTMGHMTNRASFRLHGQMFVNKRSPFLRVTLETRLVLHRGAGPSQARPFTASVRGVAIRTL